MINRYISHFKILLYVFIILVTSLLIPKESYAAYNGPSYDGTWYDDDGTWYDGWPYYTPVSYIELDEEFVEMAEGDSARLYAYVYPEDATNQEVEWYSSNESVATVDSEGNLTAVSPGVAYIYASAENWAVSTYAKVTVQSSYIPVSSIELDRSSIELTEGNSERLHAYVYPEDATNQEVEWYSSNESVATVDSEGNVTAVSPGVVYIYARAENGAVSAYAKIKVKAKPIYLQSLVIANNNLKIETGNQQTVQIIGVYSDGTEKDVTSLVKWKTSNKKIADVQGSAVVGKAVGKATITATLEGKKLAINVEVVKPRNQIKALQVSETSFRLKTKESASFKVYAIYANGTEKEVTFDKGISYRTSSSSIADVRSGKVKAGIKPGEAIITISYGGQKVTVPVVVWKNSVEELIPSVYTVTLDNKKLIHEVELQARYTDGTIRDVTSLAKWITNDSEVVQVDNGVITGVSGGLATIEAQYDNKKVTITVDVNLEERELEWLELSDKNLKLFVNEQEELKLWAVYSNGDKEEITDEDEVVWQPKNRSILDVVDGVITAKKEGTTKVTATYKGKTISLSVEVKTPKLTKLEVVHKNVTIKAGTSKTTSVYAYYDNGKKVDVTKKATWSSKRDSIATVKEGKITGVKQGSTTVYGKFDGKIVSVNVNVK